MKESIEQIIVNAINDAVGQVGEITRKQIESLSENLKSEGGEGE